MDFEARVIQILPEVTGTSKAGNPWKKKEWVVETFGQYGKKVKVQCFGDRADSLNLEEGKEYILSVDLESREYNGRWYTDVSVFRVQERGQQTSPSVSMGGSSYGQPQQGFTNPPYPTQQGASLNSPNFPDGFEESDDNLPF